MSTRPLVLIHGWGLRPVVWQGLADALAPSFSSVSLPALPGHDGRAPVPAAEIEAWTDALQTSLPAGAMVVGWSLGGMIALDLALRHPARVSKLVLIGTTPKFVSAHGWHCGLDADTVAAFGTRYAQSPQQTLQRFLALQTLGDTARREVVRKLEACSESGTLHNSALADGLSILAGTDLRASLHAVRQPALLLHGEGDALMPVDAAHYLKQALPNARLALFAGAGHAPHLGQPERCVTLIRQFADE